MKKILFLTYCYPYGHFGPSDNSSVRIMNALVRTGKYEVWNISYIPQIAGAKPNYMVNDGVKLIMLPFSERHTHHSYFIEHLILFFKIPIYPFYNIFGIWRHFKACKKLLSKNDFDLVVTQCSPEYSVITGALLKRSGLIKKHFVLFWDNIYGKFPRMVIPVWFALHRSRIVENWIARYSDCLMSPSPVKIFHDKYGEVSSAIGKRVYLEHPSVTPPQDYDSFSVEKFIKNEKINILYAGKVYFKEHLEYCMNLLNNTSLVKNINMILLVRGLSEEDYGSMKKNFKGDIILSDWIPISELNTLYKYTNFCVAFSGYNSAVSSKVYEYMSYGNPIIHFYKGSNVEDVTKLAISRYPYSLSIDMNKKTEYYIDSIEAFIKSGMGVRVPYEEVERLYPDATGTAYVKVISSLVDTQ